MNIRPLPQEKELKDHQFLTMFLTVEVYLNVPAVNGMLY
jgi:hypothetical protein